MRALRLTAIALGLAITLGAGAATAGEYDLISLGKDSAVFLDISNVRAVGSHKQAWMVLVKSRTTNFAEYSSDYAQYMDDFDCKNHTSRMVYLATYLVPGKSVSTTIGNDPFTPIIPDTNEQLVEKHVCNDSYDHENSIKNATVSEIVERARFVISKLPQ